MSSRGHLALALAVTAAALTAGCWGALDGSWEGTRSPYDVASEPTMSPSTSPFHTPVTTTSNQERRSRSATFTSVEIATGTPTRRPSPRVPAPLAEKLRTHGRTLGAAGSYRVRSLVLEAEDVGRFVRNVTLAVDLGDRRLRRITAGSRWDYFLTAEAGYAKPLPVGDAEGGEYRTLSTPDALRREFVNRSLDLAGQSLADDVARLDLEPAGTARFDGEEMDRYVATDPAAPFVPRGNVTSFSATVLVDSRGLVRFVEWRATAVDVEGDRSVLHRRIELRDVGETSVERPGWLDG